MRGAYFHVVDLDPEIVSRGYSELDAWLRDHPNAKGDVVQERIFRISADLVGVSPLFAPLAADLLLRWLYYEGDKLPNDLSDLTA